MPRTGFSGPNARVLELPRATSHAASVHQACSTGGVGLGGPERFHPRNVEEVADAAVGAGQLLVFGPVGELQRGELGGFNWSSQS